MRYKHVCLESIAYTLPDEVVTSTEIEARLEPLYTRLRLPQGRLELMTGIQERRLWAPGELPSSRSIESAQKAIDASGLDQGEIGALIHASVCRDHLEPATACRVHHGLGLRRNCLIYDVSNACLGMLNGMVQLANMIELGQIRAGIVVGTESSRPLVETTIEWLNRETALTRDDIKLAVASLTIGSGSAAVLLCHESLSQTRNRIMSAIAHADTDGHKLCHSGSDEAGSGMRPLMQTDSEKLMRDGVAAGQEAFQQFTQSSGWSAEQVDKTVCHQVGAAHRKLMLQSLGLKLENDFATFPYLGNTGSVALPITLAQSIERGHLKPNDHVAMLGIGSGINVMMMGVHWQQSAQVTRSQRQSLHDRSSGIVAAEV